MDTKPTVAVEAKPAHRSATILFNLALAATAIVALPEWNALREVLAFPDWLDRALLVTGIVGNGVLRFRTTQPVTASTTPTTAAAPAPPDRLPTAGPPRL